LFFGSFAFAEDAGKAVSFPPCRGMQDGRIIHEFCPKGFTMDSVSASCEPGMMCAAVMTDVCVGKSESGRIPRCISENKRWKVSEPCPHGYKIDGKFCNPGN
jgi:hypothetical protein